MARGLQRLYQDSCQSEYSILRIIIRHLFNQEPPLILWVIVTDCNCYNNCVVLYRILIPWKLDYIEP